MTHDPYIHKESGESSLRCDCGDWRGEHLADMEGHRAHRCAVDPLGLLDETTAEVERLQSEVDRRERQIGIHLRMAYEAGKEVDRLRAENTALAERIAEHQLLASAVRRLLGSPTRSSVLELLDVIAGARSEVATPGVLGEIAAERARQDAKWGEQNHPDGTGNKSQQDDAERARSWCQSSFGSGHGTWSDILAEEVAEANAENNNDLLRAELIQVAAVAVAWVEAIDRRALGLDQDGEGQANG